MVERKMETGASVAIAATFTAEPIQPSLEFLLRKAGLQLDVKFAPYNQVMQELISNSSTLAANPQGVNVLLVRLEDVARDIAGHLAASELLESAADEILAALTGLQQSITVCGY